MAADKNESETEVRLDKWLWAARFFKTRSLAQEAIELGRVQTEGLRMKASRSVRPGMLLTVKRGDDLIEVLVTALSEKRGSASEAAKLYKETESSRAMRQKRRDVLRYASEPSGTIRGGRPTKRDGRKLREFRGETDF